MKTLKKKFFEKKDFLHIKASTKPLKSSGLFKLI